MLGHNWAIVLPTGNANHKISFLKSFCGYLVILSLLLHSLFHSSFKRAFFYHWLVYRTMCFAWRWPGVTWPLVGVKNQDRNSDRRTELWIYHDRVQELLKAQLSFLSNVISDSCAILFRIHAHPIQFLLDCYQPQYIQELHAALSEKQTWSQLRVESVYSGPHWLWVAPGKLIQSKIPGSEWGIFLGLKLENLWCCIASKILWHIIHAVLYVSVLYNMEM